MRFARGKVLREQRLGPAGTRGGPSWREFLRAQAKSVIATDFFTVDAISSGCTSCFSSRSPAGACTWRPAPPQPDGEWVTQQARQVAWTLADRADPARFLIRDHDRKFTASFDAVFQTHGTQIIRTPIQVPEANGIAERFVRTVRSECLDWLLIVNRPHLERTLTVFVDHYNGHRPHRSLDLAPPNGRPATGNMTGGGPMAVKRRDRLDGLLHEYECAA